MAFDELNLHPDLLRAIEAQGWQDPTPIQQQAIPVIMDGRDVLGAAQTGSGKTGAFALPLLHHLLAERNPGPRVLVLVPTRELATQVDLSLIHIYRWPQGMRPLRVTRVWIFSRSMWGDPP